MLLSGAVMLRGGGVALRAMRTGTPALMPRLRTTRAAVDADAGEEEVVNVKEERPVPSVEVAEAEAPIAPAEPKPTPIAAPSPAPVAIKTTARLPHWLAAQRALDKALVSSQTREKRHWKQLPSVEQIVAFLRDENAQNVCVLDIRQRTTIASHFVFVEGFGTRHLLAMAEQLVKETKHCPLPRDLIDEVGVEGRGTDWMIVDLGATVVHFMTAEVRAHYDIESLWTGMDEDEWFPSARPRKAADTPRAAPPSVASGNKRRAKT